MQRMRTSKMSLMLFGSLLHLQVLGNTIWYQTATVNEGSSYALSNMKYWGGGDGVAPTMNDDLVSAGNFTLRVRGTAFAGNSLQLGGDGKYCLFMHETTYTVSFPPESKGLVLNHGIWRFLRQVNTYNIQGPITVESSESNPFTFLFSDRDDSMATITGPIKGQSGTSILFGPCPWWSNGAGYVAARGDMFRLLDVNGYHGNIVVTSNYENAGSQFGTAVALGSVDSDCKVVIWHGGSLTTDAADTVAKVGAIEFRKGSRLQLNFNPSDGKIGYIEARGLVSVHDRPVEVRLENAVAWDEPFRVPVLAGSSESVFSEKDFVLTCAFGDVDPYSGLLHFEVEVDPDTKIKTLYLATYVNQVANFQDEGHPHDGREGQGSSLTNAFAWSDGCVPHENSCYQTTRYLRTLNAPDEEYAFPGKALWLCGGHLRITTANFSVPDFYSSASSSISTTADSGDNTAVLCDKFHLVDGTLVLRAYKGQTLCLQGEISGNSSIEMRGINTSTRSTSAFYELAGNNTNFSGKISVSQEQNKEYLNYALKHPTLVVNDGRNLGGRMSEFDPRALKLTDIAFLSVTNPMANVVLADGLNRGVYVQDRACFNVTNGATLDVRQPILLSGKLWKDGEGTLVLGGGMKHELSEDGGELSDIPRAGSNLVEVLKGTVRIENAFALSGAMTTWGEGTKLMVNSANTEDVDLKRFGIKNVSVDVPFVLNEGLERLPISVVAPDDLSIPAVATNALFTVKDSALPSVMAMMPPLKDLSIWPTLPAKYVFVRDAANGWTTVALESKIRGTIVSIR